MSIPNASKYVIIGAGIHGLSTAYHLALELKKRNLGGGEDILVIDILIEKASFLLVSIFALIGFYLEFYILEVTKIDD